MDLVDEENRPPPEVAELVFRLLHHRPDFLHSREDGGKSDEMGLRLRGQEPRQGCFPRTRGTPEDEGEQAVLVDRLAEQGSLSQKVFLPGEFPEGTGPHPVRQGAFPDVSRLPRVPVEQVHGASRSFHSLMKS